MQPEVSHPDAESFEKLKTERDTAASQLTLLAARTEDLLRENRYFWRSCCRDVTFAAWASEGHV